MSYFDQAIVKIAGFEGSVPWMYLDTVGKVTAGVGLMLPNVAAAAVLPFQISSASRPATLNEITYDFTRVSQLPKGKLPKFYATPNQPTLPADFITAKLRAVLTGFEAEVRDRLPKYDNLPDSAKMAILDMAYNLGPAGLITKFPRLIHATSNFSFLAASKVCRRLGIGDSRNEWTIAQFTNAADSSQKS